MKEEHIKKYEEIQERFGLESTPPDDADANWRQKHIRKEMINEFCRSMCPSCGTDGCQS